MIRKTFVTASIAYLLCVSVQAQEIYTLDKCRQMALENNAKFQNAQLSLELAQQTKKEAFTKYFPSVSAIGLGFQSTDPMISIASEQGSIGMLKKGMLGMISVTQPIFAGGQIVNGNKLAKVGEEASKLQKSITNDEVLITVEQYYWQIVALDEKTKTLSEAKTLLNRVYTDVNNAYEAGLVNKNDLLKVELQQNELESNKLKVTNGQKLAKMVLAQYIGMPADSFDIDKTLAENIEAPFNFITDHQLALQRRSEYQLLEKNIEAGKLQVSMEMGKNLPSVALGGSWSYMNFDKGSPMALEDNSGMASVIVSIPISNWWVGSHALKKQKIQVRMAENEKRNTKELLLIQMQQLWNELEEAYAQMQLAEKTIVSALENVRLNEDYYKAGTGLLTDLLDAQSSLQQARDQYTEATIDYQMKLSRYKQATAQ